MRSRLCFDFGQQQATSDRTTLERLVAEGKTAQKIIRRAKIVLPSGVRAGHQRQTQFEHINRHVVAAQAAGQPVILVDTKKKEPIGNFKTAGSGYRPKGAPHHVKVHDFEDKVLGKVVPYGVYDFGAT